MKFKKSLLIIALIICIFTMASVSATDVNDTAIASEDTDQMELSTDDGITEDNLQANNEETVSAETDSEILTDGQYTYSNLREQIGSGGNINLTKGTYTYNNDGDTIEISTSGVINGNGAVIDMAQSGHRAFTVSASGVTIKNLTIKNANYNGNGGAILMDSGSVENCNFTNNRAGIGGGAILMYSGSVENCNFTYNYAYRGGAVYFMNNGEVTNCNFADNFASEGGAIFSWNWYTAADTCIFKRNAFDNFNVVIYPPTLNVDNFTTVYGSGEKLTFNLTTDSGMPVNNGNISISVYFKDNSSWVGNYSCLSGEGWAVSLPVGSYYANFTTEYAGFQPINRTLTVTTDGTTFWDLNQTINGNTNATINLDKNYTFNPAIDSAFIGGIEISRPVTINGNGYTINANGKARIFQVTSEDVALNDIIFINGNTTGEGGTILFTSTGNVTNCNFINNSASRGGAIEFKNGGTVTNCNFINNSASSGGAIDFYDDSTGNIENCNFIDNKVTGVISFGGAVNFLGNANVKNCNFTNNKAGTYGGAVYIRKIGNATNCNFINNSASSGGAIFSNEWYSTADTCIFKTSSDTTNINTDIQSPILNVDNFTTFYGSGEKLTFDLKTNSGIPVTNGNISIKVYFKNNNSWIGNYSCLSGEGWTVDLPAGSYYAIFDTEYAEFQPINRTITINKVNSTLTVGDIVFDYGSSGSATVTFTGATGVNARVVNHPEAVVNVKENTITVSDLATGTYTLKVTTIADGNHNPVTKTTTITVNKLKTKLTAKAVTTTYQVNKNLVITLKDSAGKALNGVKVTVKLKGTKTYTTDKNGQIKINVAKLVPKKYTAKVTFAGNKNYKASSADVKVTVKKAKAKIKAKKKTYKANKKTKKFKITLKDKNGKPIKKAKVRLIVKKIKKNSKKKTTNKTKKNKKKNIKKTNKKGKITFKINRNKKGKYLATVKFYGNKYYAKTVKKVKIKMK